MDHSEQYKSPYTPAQLFDLVADVEHYPEFLPWCAAARILKQEENLIIAELVIHFKNFQERYTSRVTLNRPHEIIAEMIDGPFEYLYNKWQFVENDDGGTIVNFNISFKFRVKLWQVIIGLMFEKSVKKMVAAFEKRAEKIWGR
jgi:coenzyme Q-binding protein COQ10